LLAEVAAKVAKAQEEKLDELQKEKEHIAQKQKDSLDHAASAIAQREEEQKEADEREKVRLLTRHERQLKEQGKEAERAVENAAVVNARMAHMAATIEEIIKKQEASEMITRVEMDLLVGYNNDPVLGPFIKWSATLADLINSNAASQLSASQSQPSSLQLLPSASQPSTTATTISKCSKTISCCSIVDLTYSDDENDGVDLVLKSQLRQIPWQSHGLSASMVTPALWALKNMEEEDQKLFSNNSKAWEIFDLGIKALKAKEAHVEESSGGSDHSKRSYTVGPGATSPKSKPKKKKRMVIDSEAFAASVQGSSSSTKGKGKKQATPTFTPSDSSDDE